MKELQTVEEIDQFFQELRNKPTGIFQQARLYGMAVQMQEIESRKREIEELFQKSHSDRVLDITLLNDEHAILKVESTFKNKQEVLYAVFVNGNIHYSFVRTFDEALALFLAVKYGFEDYFGAIVNMLKMREEKN